MSEELVSQSAIVTKCQVPNETVLKWLLGMFPEMAQDANLTDAGWGFGSGCVEFTVRHTIQKPVPGAVGPVLLEPPSEEIGDEESEE